jgi:hypothetical protein
MITLFVDSLAERNVHERTLLFWNTKECAYVCLHLHLIPAYCGP